MTKVRMEREVYMDCSIVIPVRNEFPQIAFTIDSVQQEIKRCNLDAEIIIVFNGNTDKGDEYLANRGSPSYKVLHSPISGCWQARNLGAENSKGSFLIFLDAHVLVEPYSVKFVLDFLKKREDIGICFFPIRYLLDTKHIAYGYKKAESSFWGHWTHKKYHDIPYHMPISGAAAFGIRSETFVEIGGYNKHFGIYGGGEPYIGYKLEMYGYINAIHPDACVAHYAGKRGYSWNNDIVWTNFLLASYVLGGKELSNVYYKEYQKRCNNVQRYLDRLDELYTNAIRMGEEDRAVVQSRAVKSIQQVMEGFDYRPL